MRPLVTKGLIGLLLQIPCSIHDTAGGQADCVRDQLGICLYPTACETLEFRVHLEVPSDAKWGVDRIAGNSCGLSLHGVPRAVCSALHTSGR